VDARVKVPEIREGIKMRLCRFARRGITRAGFFQDEGVIDLNALARRYRVQEGPLPLEADPLPDDLLVYLPPDGEGMATAQALWEFLARSDEPVLREPPVFWPWEAVRLRVPIPHPPKLLCLAGNYTAHVEESGLLAKEREETFPRFFLKPTSTTLSDPEATVALPTISPHHIDWEVELAVVIGRRGKHIPAEQALDHVAGYTLLLDLSDRDLRLNPHRVPRLPWDDFFDWMHGKWHDGFAPLGPCIASAQAIPNPQTLAISLRVNEQTMQDSNTGNMIFPVADLIAYASSFMTLEAGDVIATGTPSGVGMARGLFLKPGDLVEGTVEGIGTLRVRMAEE